MNTTTLQSHVDRLDDALIVWAGLDDTKPQAGVRRAANVAMDSVDALLHELYRMRAELIGQIRVSDDANAERVDALLRERSAW